VGSTITVDLALQSVIVKSANDIAVALAEAVGGSEAQFVEQMNATARRLGMTRTVFRNPHGLPAPEQVTTARDLARLSLAVVRDFPQYAHYWAQSQMQIANIRIVSHNGLFKTLEGVDGLKTGFICDSGYNMVASATREGVRLMAVVLGEMSAADRNQRAQQLIEHGYATLGWKTLFGARETVATLPVPPTAKDAASIRSSVVAMECQNKRIARAAQVARKRAKARSKAEAAARKAGDKPGAASAPKAAAAAQGGAMAAPKAAAAPTRSAAQPAAAAPAR
jgi:D-alanyl-D-alanine carboxypeptidase